jgi:Bacterial Ig domain
MTLGRGSWPGICPINNTAPEYLSLRSDGTFLVAFRHDAGLPEYLGQCAYGVATLDLSGTSPVYKQLYETVPSVSFEYQNTLAVQALFEQQGKFYTLFYKSIGSMFGSFGYFLQEIGSDTNPLQENIVTDSISEGYRGSVSMTVFEGHNNKLYGIKKAGNTNLDGIGGSTSVLFEVEPNITPTYTTLETFTSSISYDENYQFVYSPGYPNALGDFVKADRLGNYFLGTRNTGLTQGKVLFRLDNTGPSPVYYEYPDVRIPLQFGNLMLFANNAFYGEKLVSQISPDGNPKYQRTLVKVTVTGVELLPPINTAPVAMADTYKIHYKGKKPVTIAPPGLLKNDSDAEGDKLSVFGIDAGKPRVIRVSGKQGKVGKVEVFNDGRLVFTPPRCKPPRVITFSYQATDGKSSSNSVVVTLNIKTNRKDEK